MAQNKGKIREWQRVIKREVRNFQRADKCTEQQQEKLMKEIRQAARGGDMHTARSLAHQLVSCRRTTSSNASFANRANALGLALSTCPAEFPTPPASQRKLEGILNSIIKHSQAFSDLACDMAKAGFINLDNIAAAGSDDESAESDCDLEIVPFGPGASNWVAPAVMDEEAKNNNLNEEAALQRRLDALRR
eukprot:TRINITY_DN103403_c0_g1_i1.p1 TRINITY_DN103403_c0_g1~~TRINITY_DN103403_c0_g1_i1.p1  ORF type:complete len:207 (-),score=24.92 TRINITY_DN103403_c0_g1_i1:64-636(-)